MPTIRDDSAGSYGTWNNDDLSWLDYLTAKASDGGNALANLGRNLVDGFSPIGTSEQGNMALQVPPIVSGIAQSYGRLAGSPSHPGNAYDLTGVPELDATIQSDMSNVLLSLYGGNAVSGLAKGGAARAAAQEPSRIRGVHYTTADFDRFAPEQFGGTGDAFGTRVYSTPMEHVSAQTVRDGRPYSYGDRSADGARSIPTEHVLTNPFRIDMADAFGSTAKADWQSLGPQWRHEMAPYEAADAGHFPTREDAARAFNQALKANGRDGVTVFDDGIMREVMAMEPGRVMSPLTGETLFSDTGKPSILGSAMAGAGDGLPMDHASRMARAREMGFDVDTPLYHGTKNPGFDAFDEAYYGSHMPWSRQGTHLTANPEEAFIYSGDEGAIIPTFVRPGKHAEVEAHTMRSLGEFHSKLQELKDAGYDSASFPPTNERVVFDPRNIRSVNAAFDPAHADSSNILLSGNRPSLLGSALATAGENYDLPEWLRF